MLQALGQINPINAIVLAVSLGLLGSYFYNKRRDAKGNIRPAGHIAWAEASIQFVIVLLMTFLSCIAAYVTGGDELQAVLNGSRNGGDIVVSIFCLGLGAGVEFVGVVAASRVRTGMVRRKENPVAFKQERLWFYFSLVVFMLIALIEMATSTAFFYKINPRLFPSGIGPVIKGIEGCLAFVRADLPSAMLIFLVVGVLPMIISLTDRKRELLSYTTQKIVSFEKSIVDVDKPLPPEKLKAALTTYKNLVAISEFAGNATPEEKAANTELLQVLTSNSGFITETMVEALATKDEIAVLEGTHKVTLAELEQRFQDKLADEVRIMRTEMARHYEEMIGKLEGVANSVLGAPQEGELVGLPQSMRRIGNIDQVNPAKPTPNSKAFPKWVYDQAYVLMRDANGAPINLASLAQYTGYDAAIVGEALRTYRPTAERRLGKGETMADNIVYANSGFYLPASTTA